MTERAIEFSHNKSRNGAVVKLIGLISAIACSSLWYAVPVVNTYFIALQLFEIALIVITICYCVLLLVGGTSIPTSKNSTAVSLFTLILIFLVLIFLISSISAVVNNNLLNGLRVAVRPVAGAFATISVFGIVYAGAKVQWFFIAILMGSLCTTFIQFPDLYEWFVHSRFDYVGREKGFFLNSNQLGLVAGSAIPLSLAIIASKNFRTIIGWLSLIALTALVIVSGSKTVFVLLILVIPFWFFSEIRSKRVTKYDSSTTIRKGFSFNSFLYFIFGALVFPGFILGFSVFASRQIGRLVKLIRDPEQVSGLQTRLDAWKEAISLAMETPIIGVGPAAAGKYLGLSHTHNVLVEAFFTTGILGLCIWVFLYIIFMIWIFRLWNIKKDLLNNEEQELSRGMAGCLIIYLLGNMTGSVFTSSTVGIFWIVLGASFGMTARRRERRFLKINGQAK